MTAPNIGGFTLMTGNTAVQQVGLTANAIVTNNSSSNQLYKVYSLNLCNVSGNAVSATVDIYRNSVAYRFAANLVIPSTSSIVVITKDNGVYLNEGDSLRLTAGTISSVEAICSYEVVA
jgi:hypothetical protein